MIQAIERYMKQAIVDRNPAVASAALVSSFVSTSHLSIEQLPAINTYSNQQMHR